MPESLWLVHVPLVINTHHHNVVRPQAKWFQDCRKATHNMSSALGHPEVIRDYLAKECAQGRILGPFQPHALQVSRLGVVPKDGGQAWRLITDLLSPEGAIMNDGISGDLSTLSYVSVDDAARAIVSRGRGAGAPGESRHQDCLQKHACPPGRQAVARHDLGQQPLCGRSITFWAPLSTKIFLVVADAISG